jgi:hypothetical protein
MQQLQRDNARLRHKLERAELIIDAQKKTVRGTGAADGGRDERGRVMLAVAELTPHVGLRSACQAFVPRSRPAPRDRVTARTAAAAPVGALDRRAGSVAGPSRQRALFRAVALGLMPSGP